jgi:hypothetical protein
MLLNFTIDVSFWLGIKHHDHTLLEVFWVHASSYIVPCHIFLQIKANIMLMRPLLLSTFIERLAHSVSGLFA